MWAFSLYNDTMKLLVHKRLNTLSDEIENLHAERRALMERQDEIQVRMHQLVGAIYELQQLIVDLDHQPSEKPWSVETPEDLHQVTHPSEGVDLNIHQELQEETEKSSLQQS